VSAAHPYRDLPDYQFWPRAVTWAAPGALDPVVATRFLVGPDDRVATIGSCFAQHLSRHLRESGLHYFVAETGPDGIDADEAKRRNYGVFSARYGNVYTVAQANQLLQRAYGEFEPQEDAWRLDSRVVDPFRPQAEPDGFADHAALEADREQHLQAVRDVFERADILVFTLGLTEAWRSRADGSVFPSAPGVAGGEYDPAKYEFVNFSVDEVRDGLIEFCARVRSINPAIRVLLTVSPVPLVATYEDRHVLVATTYSKSVLRVAAEEARRHLEYVDYFPSYEIIAAATAPQNYYADDLREVEEAGVQHVMRVFTRHYVDGLPWSKGVTTSPLAASKFEDVICDEAAIAAAIEASTPGASELAGSSPDVRSFNPQADDMGVRGGDRSVRNDLPAPSANTTFLDGVRRAVHALPWRRTRTR
jgi:hypothetical protein